MRRREYIILLGSATVWWPLAAGAQQAPPSRQIGVLLNAFSPEEQAPQAFRQGLRDAGYSVGGDVVIEWRAAHGDRSRLPELAADLVQRKVDVIVGDSTPAPRRPRTSRPPFPSSWPSWPIRLDPAWSRASRAPAGMLPGSQ
jgi:putative ABC transport system substrate-binding protein